MSKRLSNQDADALRHWFALTVGSHANASDIGLRMGRRPLRLLVLVYLALQPSESALLNEVRRACRIEPEKRALAAAVDSLSKAGFVTKVRTRTRSGERELRLTDQGRIAVGTFAQSRHPHPDDCT